MTSPPRPRVLVVDDEPNVLHGLRRTLRAVADVHAYDDPRQALVQLEADVADELEPAVVVCDMRMPGLDGAQVLSRVRQLSPDSTRMLLTGQTDVEAAVRAVNEGGIFRFLTKPCPPEELLAALHAAVQQHRLVTAEKVLLEQTLKGAVSALLETLCLADPQVFNRGARVKRLATGIARAAGTVMDWELQVALVLAHVGLVSVPRPVLDRLDAGAAITVDEQAVLDRSRAVSAQLLQGIPRLEQVQEAVALSTVRYDGRGAPAGAPVGDALPLAARMLHLATALERTMTSGLSQAEAAAVLADDAGAYDPVLLGAAGDGQQHQRRLSLVAVDDLRRNMTVAADITSPTGVLLVGRGSTVTAGLVERLRNHLAAGNLAQRVLVEAPDAS